VINNDSQADGWVSTTQLEQPPIFKCNSIVKR
jgi:hypothetical protein